MLYQPKLCGPELPAGIHSTSAFRTFWKEVVIDLTTTTEPLPAPVIDGIHAEGTTGTGGDHHGGAVLADPVTGPGMPAIDDGITYGVQHLEGGNDGAGGQRVSMTTRPEVFFLDISGPSVRNYGGAGRLQTRWTGR